jgi:hypothetical protein
MLEDVVKHALRMPGGAKSKIYTQRKLLFRDIDVGANTGTWIVNKYNGELFKYDEMLDNLELDDDLANKIYATSSKRVVCIWGLHVFDYWRELDKDRSSWKHI